MTPEQLINSLSEQGQKDLIAAGQWINPIPADIKTLLEKITIALQMVRYSQNRQGAKAANSSANEHLYALMRLKTEIESLTMNN